MGLDISYYKLGKMVEPDTEDDFEVYSDEWHDKYGHLINIQSYGLWDQNDDLQDGLYENDYLGGFRAGSYSGYGWFRDTLTSLADVAISENEMLKEKYGEDSEPFTSLTNFSDCEGYLGPFTCSMLSEVFTDFEKPIIQDIIKMAKYGGRNDVYDKYTRDDLDYFIIKYREWREAFVETAGKGVVLFH